MNKHAEMSEVKEKVMTLFIDLVSSQVMYQAAEGLPVCRQ